MAVLMDLGANEPASFLLTRTDFFSLRLRTHERKREKEKGRLITDAAKKTLFEGRK